MQAVKSFFAFIGKILSFIGNNFKALVFLLIIYLLFFANSTPVQNANLAEINLSGAIMDDKDMLDQIYKIKDDENIKGVLLNINSPGGALSPSVEISMAIKELAAKKPVVAYASGTMASGSYLSGVWANKILANPGSFIGSIGVIMQGMEFSKLAEKIGVSEQTVSAGEFKQAGTPTRPWRDDEKAALQELVNKSYELFTSEVAKARGLDLNKTNTWANARVFLAKEAKEVGLIDEVSNYQKAKLLTQKLAKINDPIWKQDSEIEKAFKKFSAESKSYISSFFGAKIEARSSLF